ncbi:MAG: CRTAC1 family protein, partial [Acidobacteria bacterium]|nr:CRTAC1 family protein [Acidobacteriota bacterium]NIM61319.1 CRTAC1 family protein [Acidobacteriota bacterium]NIO58783.1 CRTAC1 family protein [Acidobacteriota bacterium]NIQ29826.1 CRTAC1 family protein [Acidobacteriota bacterium]NIQ84549.1 CRTAC1 family protein [Acidobacteriota bacterium]
MSLGRPTAAVALVLVLAACAESRPEPSEPHPAPHFVDIASAAGLDVVQVAGGANADYIIDSLGTGGAWLDYDGDGDPDLYLVQGATKDAPEGPPDRLYRNDGDDDGNGVPEFEDVTSAAGLGDRNWGVGVAVADYDNDGDPDLYVTNWGPNRLYRNDGDGSFTDVAAGAGVGGADWSTSAAWTDADLDGDLDLYVTNYVDFGFDRYPARGEQPANAEPCVWRGVEIFCGPRNLEPSPDRYYRNDGDPDGDGIPEFVEATEAAGLVPLEPAYGIAVRVLDADADGDDDIYVANDSVQNLLFVNQGDGSFVEESILAGLAYSERGTEQAGMGIAVGDYDGDGRLDLAVTNFSHDHDTLYRNDGDLLFTDVSFPSGLGTASYFTLGWGIDFLDLDLDGWQDLFVCHGHVYPQVDGRDTGSTFRQVNGLYRNAGDGTLLSFEGGGGPAMAIEEASRTLLPVDLEGDGDLDLLVTNVNAPPNLLRNDGALGNWLSVRLRGTRSNADGIGARVVATVGTASLMREIRREASYAGSV